MSHEVHNTELSVGDIPSFKESWPRIEPFAYTFDGFRYWGSIERCAEEAEKTPSTLTQLRTCLFFEAKRWKHLKSEPDEPAMRRIRALVFAIGEKVKKGELR
jgi:hypothetical protein